MSVNAKHYLPTGKEYKGPTHKMGKQVHTGVKHTVKSQKLTHKKNESSAKKP
jgi:hypothetical protein